MYRKIITSFVLALQNIRSNFFHTILSILGIVIGVAALVGILSLIDGAEEFARRQISQTTSLNAIVVQNEVFKRTNEVRVRKDTFRVIDYEQYLEFKTRFQDRAKVYLRTTASDEVLAEGQPGPLGVFIYGTGELLKSNTNYLAGQSFSEKDLLGKSYLTVVNYKMASLLSGQDSIQSLMGRKVKYLEHDYVITGILSDDQIPAPEMYIPITTLPSAELKVHSPVLALDANKVEDVPALKEELTAFMAEKFGDNNDDFSIITNEFRVRQAQQGFLLFRVVMGIIVGISVMVGGIGVMNVLLISVTERTIEIGIRKAVGANKADVVLQFMCEAITVSVLGSFVGLVVGVLGTMAAIPVIRAITEAPFSAVFTINTLLVVSVVAVVVGIVFGTYPAFRAAKLDPVEAIRRE